MLEDLKENFNELKERFYELKQHLSIDKKKSQLHELEAKMADADFWNKPQDEINEYTRKIKLISGKIKKINELESDIEEIETSFELLEEENDESLFQETLENLNKLKKEIKIFEAETLLSSKYDILNSYLEIHPGAGGTESCDWAQMLLRMYTKWAEAHNFEIETINLLPGDVAGIKSVTLLIKGEYVYGLLKGESGVHRLVRISPFDANKRRHTSFASVLAFPELSDEIEIELNEKDLKIDVFRSSGAGGQHVNVTDSAVRITHLPTGIVVSCQNERSQHANKQTALKILMAKLYQLKEKEKEDELKNIQGEKKEIGWGHQIRSYVFHPYRLIKDLRTGYETGNVEPVMDGYIDEFIETWLKFNAKH